jgi:hypothetical protein
VIDSAGKDVGHVHDVRLVQDGPVVGSFGASFRLEGLIVGKGSVGTRLGYDRSAMKGPFVLKRLFAGMRSVKFVDWHNVTAIEGNKIHIDVEAERLSAPEILTD